MILAHPGTPASSLLALVFASALGCSGSVRDAEPSYDNSVGQRCDSADNCDPGQTCKTDFPYERAVCTAECSQDADCGQESHCVDVATDYDGRPFEASYCLRPCAADFDCPGSVCDDRATGSGYCF